MSFVVVVICIALSLLMMVMPSTHTHVSVVMVVLLVASLVNVLLVLYDAYTQKHINSYDEVTK